MSGFGLVMGICTILLAENNRMFRDLDKSCGQNITDATVCTGGKMIVVLHDLLLILGVMNEWN